MNYKFENEQNQPFFLIFTEAGILGDNKIEKFFVIIIKTIFSSFISKK